MNYGISLEASVSLGVGGPASLNRDKLKRAFGPKLASPQTFFDGRNAVKDLTSREAFDDLDNLGRAIARHRWHQKMDVIFVSANLSKGYFVPFGDV